MNSEQIMKQFPDWKEIEPGNWSKHPIILTYGCSPYEYIEIGLYRELHDGSYTLQGFNGDDVVFCVAVQ